MAHKDILKYERSIGCTIDELAAEVKYLTDKVTDMALIVFRTKDLQTLKKKMRFKNTENIFLIDDVYGIRIIVGSVNEAYQVLEKMSQVFPGFLDHDYIKNPKTRPDKLATKGKMLRLLQFIAYKNGVPFEVQITTTAFNEMNESLHAGYHCDKYHS